MHVILTVAANTDKQENKSFTSDGRQFSCMLEPSVMVSWKMTVNLKSVYFSSFGIGLQKILS